MLDKIKEIALKIYSFSPFVSGLLIGYFGKPIIQIFFKLLG